MNLRNLSIAFFGLLLLAQPVIQAETVTLTVETDRPYVPAGEKQAVYLRIGLAGCAEEFLKERRPVNVSLVIDKSGSMSGDKIEKAKDAAIMAIRRLQADDIASIVIYDDQAEVLVPATKMSRTEDSVKKIRRIRADGSTALYDGIQNGAREVRKFLSKNHVNRIVLLSDGLANVGPSSTEELGRLGCNLADEGISVTTIGLGLGYNEDLMSQLAYRSDGGHYFAEEAEELAAIFDQEFDRAMSVVAQQVRLEIICGEEIRPVRVLGRQGSIKDRTVQVDLQNIYAGHEKYVLLEVEVPAGKKEKARELACVRLNYQDMKMQAEIKKPGQACEIRFTDSSQEVEKNLNARVTADVVEQIAIENNQRALALRDQGQTQQAKEALEQNTTYLNTNASRLKSEKLSSYAAENEEDADNLEGKNWTRQRKSMRESQTRRQTQQ
jgi:Ca-activated chloride channel homolog